MKKTILLTLFLATTGIICNAAVKNTRIEQHQQTKSDTLSIYTGKYQNTIHNNLFYIQFDLVDGNLIGSTLWDGNKMLLKHLSGDNFIVSGIDWSIKFIRDKNGKVNEVVVKGTDYWVRVKN